MNNKTPQEFCDLINKLITDGWTIAITLISDFSGERHHRMMQVLHLEVRGDQYEAMLMGYGVCGIAMGTLFSFSSPKPAIIAQ